MTGVTLTANDAAEVAEMPQFLADWLGHDASRLGPALEDFVGHPAYNVTSCRLTWSGSPSCSAAATANPSWARRSDNHAARPTLPASREYAGGAYKPVDYSRNYLLDF